MQQPDDEGLRSHLEAVAVRSEAESNRLARRLLERAWPAGIDDSCRPAALDWVRRWRPATAYATASRCVCSTGRCAVCN